MSIFLLLYSVIKGVNFMDLVQFSDFKSEQFQEIFREYYLEEGIVLRENTMVFEEIQKSADKGNTKCFILLESEKIIGFIMFKTIQLNNDNGFIKQNIGHIEEVFIDKNNRKKGYGKLLLLRVEEYFKNINIKKIFLTARTQVHSYYCNLGYFVDDSYICANNLKCYFKSL